MAEVQTTTLSGELTQHFIEFVMMQAQNAALFLGQIPNAQGEKGEVNLELAKMFIDQLGMIQEKTRGNLSNEEATMLRNTISNLQMVFVEVSREARGGSAPATPAPTVTPPPAETAASAPPPAGASDPPPPPQTESESRKKFTKSYGA